MQDTAYSMMFDESAKVEVESLVELEMMGGGYLMIVYSLSKVVEVIW
jgi:hypothetical protein